MQLTIKLTGQRPMLHHNGRLANPTDPYTRELKALTSKRKKTDEDLILIMQAESRGSCWETEDGRLGIPNGAVWRCIFDSATAFRLGKVIKAALNFEDITVPLLSNGREWLCDEYIRQPGAIDYRPVRVQTARTMRARTRVTNWSSIHQFELLEDVLDPRDLAPVLERAGRLVGLGDWRPTYGTFVPEVVKA